jgi:hypothetical protein
MSRMMSIEPSVSASGFFPLGASPVATALVVFLGIGAGAGVSRPANQFSSIQFNDLVIVFTSCKFKVKNV